MKKTNGSSPQNNRRKKQVGGGARSARQGDGARKGGSRGGVRGERGEARKGGARCGDGRGQHAKAYGAQGDACSGDDRNRHAKAHDVRGGARGQRRDACEGGEAASSRQSSSLCPVSHLCGACQTIDVPYAQQLAAKQDYMEALFADVAPREAMRPVLGMEEPFRYRNKVISPYAPGRKLPPRAGKGAAGTGRVSAGSAGNRSASGKAGKQSPRREILTGMYQQGTHKLVPTDGCLLENRIAKKVILAVRDIMARYGVEPYDEDAGTGFIRHAVVRVGHNSGEVLVTLVTNGDEFPSSKAFCRKLVKRVPQVTTVVQNVNTRNTNVILGEKERTLYGPGFILDTLCGLSFRISSHSFYQVNSTQTEVLYEQAIRLAELTGEQTVIDAYCGTGTIGLVAAKRGAARVIGVDNVESAIADARLNARHNGIENAEFVAADASVFMRDLAAQRDAVRSADLEGEVAAVPTAPVESRTAADFPESSASEAALSTRQPAQTPGELVLFMDPPRAGSTERFLDAAAVLVPERIVYISCNPETQVRDIAYLRRRGYRTEVVQPVDMFPHTEHVESIALLVRT